MTTEIKMKLKCSKLNKTYKNGKTKIDFDEQDRMSTTCTHAILKAK